MNRALQDKAVELAWRQWTALGVAGVAPPAEQGVDLEALIAFTPFAAATDPRLAGESIDWCLRIGPHYLSVSRLRQIARLFERHTAAGSLDLVSLAIGAAGGRTKPVDVSGKSRLPRLDQPALIQLRSRHIFGIGARADAVTTLVMQRREMVRLSSIGPGYTKRAMALVMDDLASAGVVEKVITSGAAHYKLIKEAPLRSLLAPLPTRLPRWVERFALVAALLGAWMRMPAHAPSSRAIELAKLLDQLRPLAAALGKTPPTTGRPSVLLDAITAWGQTLLDP